MATSARRKLSKRSGMPDLKDIPNKEQLDFAPSMDKKLVSIHPGERMSCLPIPPTLDSIPHGANAVGSTRTRSWDESHQDDSTAKDRYIGTEIDLDRVFSNMTELSESFRGVTMAIPDMTLTSTGIIDGVETEMFQGLQPGRAAAGSRGEASNDYDKRQTRSESRRHERVRSDRQHQQPKLVEVPAGLTIRKVLEPDVNQQQEIARGSTDRGLSSTRYLPTPTDQVVPPPSQPLERSAPASQPQPSRLAASSVAPQRLSSYRRSQQDKVAGQEMSPMKVVPPTAPSSNVLPGYVWTSKQSSTSRPSGPWGWMKMWTCCQCSHLDPFRAGEPAQTMIEQKVCSRLLCGHERCYLGCTTMQ